MTEARYQVIALGADDVELGILQQEEKEPRARRYFKRYARILGEGGFADDVRAVRLVDRTKDVTLERVSLDEDA